MNITSHRITKPQIKLLWVFDFITAIPRENSDFTKQRKLICAFTCYGVQLPSYLTPHSVNMDSNIDQKIPEAAEI